MRIGGGTSRRLKLDHLSSLNQNCDNEIKEKDLPIIKEKLQLGKQNSNSDSPDATGCKGVQIDSSMDMHYDSYF